MKTWSERRWWHNSFVFGPFVAVLAAFVFLLFPHHFSKEISAVFIFCSLLLLLASAMLIVQNLDRTTTVYNKWWSLAVVNKVSGIVVATRLKKVYLRPWPLPTQYSFMEFPVFFQMQLQVQPITSNPKVVPLVVSITTKLVGEPDDVYIKQTEIREGARRVFHSEVFELLQHRLPREVADDVNPFDRASMDRFADFVKRELDPRLPFGHQVDSVNVYLQQ